MKRWVLLLILLTSMSGCASWRGGRKAEGYAASEADALNAEYEAINFWLSMRQGGAQVGETTFRYLSYPFQIVGDAAFGVCESAGPYMGTREGVFVTLAFVGVGGVCMFTGYYLEVASDWFELYTDSGRVIHVPIDPPAEEAPFIGDDSGLLRSAEEQNSQ